MTGESGFRAWLSGNAAPIPAPSATGRHQGLARVEWQFTLALAAYDLIRLPKLRKPPEYRRSKARKNRRC